MFHQVRHLAKQHAVHLCSFVDEPDDLQSAKELESHCASVDLVYRGSLRAPIQAVAALLRGLPLSVSLFDRREFAKTVRKLGRAERFDCVIVSSSSMAQYADMLQGVPRIIDFIDVDSEKWRLYAQFCKSPLSWIYAREANLLGRYEDEITRNFNRVLVVAESEREVLQKRSSGKSTVVVSNGVDLDYFSSPSDTSGCSGRSVIVFTGVMDYFPNVDAVRYFCESIFPRVRDAVPGAQFYIVGRNPTRQVRKLARQSGVAVTGTVPDVRPYLTQAAVAVAPFRLARGVQNKVLEAMAMGLPVVGTSETFKGIAATEADGIRIADEPLSFAEQVIDVLQSDLDTRRHLAERTRSYVERNHRWEEQGEKLEKILMDVVERRRRSATAEGKSAALA